MQIKDFCDCFCFKVINLCQGQEPVHHGDNNSDINTLSVNDDF